MSDERLMAAQYEILELRESRTIAITEIAELRATIEKLRYERVMETVELYRLISATQCDPGDGTVKPTIEDALTRGFHAMGWANPMLASYEACYAIAQRLTEPGHIKQAGEVF